MDKITRQIRIEHWTQIMNECLNSGMNKTEWCRARVMTHTPVLIQPPMINSMGKSLSSAEQLWNEPTVINLL